MSTGVEVHADAAPPVDPLALAASWLPADDDPDRPRVTLSTQGLDGWPNARTVLLSAVDASGFAFHSSAGSAKAAELAATPRAAMTVLWPGTTRQLVVRGDVAPCPPAELATAYAARSPYLRQLAWLNDDELAALPQHERRARWTTFLPPHGDPPAGWVGWRLVPRELTFWAGDPDGVSRRLQYRRTDDGWTVRPLAG